MERAKRGPRELQNGWRRESERGKKGGCWQSSETVANKENVKRMSRGKHQRDFSGPVTGTTDICMRLAFYIILRRVRVREGGKERGGKEGGSYRSYTHTVWDSERRKKEKEKEGRWSSHADKLTYRQPAKRSFCKWESMLGGDTVICRCRHFGEGRSKQPVCVSYFLKFHVFQLSKQVWPVFEKRLTRWWPLQKSDFRFGVFVESVSFWKDPI